MQPNHWSPHNWNWRKRRLTYKLRLHLGRSSYLILIDDLSMSPIRCSALCSAQRKRWQYICVLLVYAESVHTCPIRWMVLARYVVRSLRSLCHCTYSESCKPNVFIYISLESLYFSDACVCWNLLPLREELSTMFFIIFDYYYSNFLLDLWWRLMMEELSQPPYHHHHLIIIIIISNHWTLSSVRFLVRQGLY